MITYDYLNALAEDDLGESEPVPSNSSTPVSKVPWKQQESVSKKKDFTSSFLESKEAEIKFKMECFNTEMELKAKEIEMKEKYSQLELDLKREELLMRKKDAQTDIIKTLITQGKSAAEIKEFMTILSSE